MYKNKEVKFSDLNYYLNIANEPPIYVLGPYKKKYREPGYWEEVSDLFITLVWREND